MFKSSKRYSDILFKNSEKYDEKMILKALLQFEKKVDEKISGGIIYFPGELSKLRFLLKKLKNQKCIRRLNEIQSKIYENSSEHCFCHECKEKNKIQAELLEANQINQLFDSVKNQNQKLYFPECAKCSKVFFHEFQFPGTLHSSKKDLILVQYQDSIKSIMEIAKRIHVLENGTGGILLIGGTSYAQCRKQPKLKDLPLKQLLYIESVINSRLLPEDNKRIQKIPIKNYKYHQKQNQQYILKICINPSKTIKFLKIDRQICVYRKIKGKIHSLKGQQIYRNMVQSVLKNRKKFFCQQKIKLNQKQPQLKRKQSAFEQIYLQGEQEVNICFFCYDISEDEIIKVLKTEMKMKEAKVFLPYQQIQKKNFHDPETFWVVVHDQPFQYFQEKFEKITESTVKNIANQLSYYDFDFSISKKLRQQMRQRFRDSPKQKQIKQEQCIWHFIFDFRNMKQAIFAYIFLKKQRIQVDFLKQS